MANKKFGLGILGMVLVFGMMVVGCDLDNNPFDGRTLTHQDGIGRLNFSSTTWRMTNWMVAGTTERGDWEGTYTHSGNVATMTLTRSRRPATTGVWVTPTTVTIYSTTINSDGSMTFSASPPTSRSIINTQQEQLKADSPAPQP